MTTVYLFIHFVHDTNSLSFYPLIQFFGGDFITTHGMVGNRYLRW